MRRKTERGAEDVLDATRRVEPETGTRMIASAIGNRALSNLITTGAVATRAIARDPKPPGPVKPAPPAVKKVNFPDADKERARTMVVAPLRAVAEKLAVGEKADIAWVLRHLKPIPTAVDGVKWPDDMDTINAAYAAVEDFDDLLTVLKSMKLDHRHAVRAAVHAWHASKRLLEETQHEIRAGIKASERAKEPPRDGAESDINALTALEQEIDAVCEDLVKAPHSQEGMHDVEKTAGGMLAQFDTIQPGEAGGIVEQAKTKFVHGFATIVPLAEGKAETITLARKAVVEMANKLAAILGDAPPAGDPSAADDDPPVQVPPPATTPTKPSGSTPPPAPAPTK